MKKVEELHPLASLEAEIRTLAGGVRRLLEKTDLTDDALVMLIQSACSSRSTRGRYSKPTRKAILDVLHAVGDLDAHFLKSAQARREHES